MFKPALMGLVMKIYCCFEVLTQRGGGGTPYDGLYGEAPPERKGVLGFRYMKRYVFHLLNYIKGYANLSFGPVKGPKRANR